MDHIHLKTTEFSTAFVQKDAIRPLGYICIQVKHPEPDIAPYGYLEIDRTDTGYRVNTDKVPMAYYKVPQLSSSCATLEQAYEEMLNAAWQLQQQIDARLLAARQKKEERAKAKEQQAARVENIFAIIASTVAATREGE